MHQTIHHDTLPIYLDYNASTPVDERVVEAMLPYFRTHFGNPSSANHAYGWKAEAAVEVARKKVASCIGAAEAQEIIFSSGATESVNLALKGIAQAHGKGHIITVQSEHKAVLDSCHALERDGYTISYLGVDSEGFVSVQDIADAITPETFLVSVMHVNNETGVIQDIAAIGALCREHGILFHTDATQAVGKIPFHVREMNVDLCSFTAHKFYGPKGVGCLYVRKAMPRIRLLPQIDGGGHEFGMRSGTLNVPGIVGLAKALEIAINEMQQENERLSELRNSLYLQLKEGIDHAVVNGPDPFLHAEKRLSGNLNISFPGVQSGVLMTSIHDVAVSASAACGTTDGAYSHVLKAMKVGQERGSSAIRFGVGRYTTREEIEFAAQRFCTAVNSMKQAIA